jgi:hypothetical protein
MLNREKGSYGQMISTMCFAGVGLFLLGEAAITEGQPLKLAFMAFCAELSLAGALRFQIAKLAEVLPRLLNGQ